MAFLSPQLWRSHNIWKRWLNHPKQDAQRLARVYCKLRPAMVKVENWWVLSFDCLKLIRCRWLCLEVWFTNYEDTAAAQALKKSVEKPLDKEMDTSQSSSGSILNASANMKANQLTEILYFILCSGSLLWGSTKLCGVTMERSRASFMNVVHLHWDDYTQGLHVAILVEHKAQKFFFFLSEEFSWASHCDEHGARIAWTRSNKPGFDPGHPMEWLTTRCGDTPRVHGGTWPSHIPSHSNKTDVPPRHQPEAVS